MRPTILIILVMIVVVVIVLMVIIGSPVGLSGVLCLVAGLVRLGVRCRILDRCG